MILLILIAIVDVIVQFAIIFLTWAFVYYAMYKPSIRIGRYIMAKVRSRRSV